MFFSLDRYSTSSPSPSSKLKSITSWINELDDEPNQAQINPPLISIKQTQRKSSVSRKPLLSNPNICTSSAPFFPKTKQLLGKRKSFIMNDVDQPAHSTSPRRSGRSRSPTKKVLESLESSSASKTNSIHSILAQVPELTTSINIPVRTKPPIKVNQSPRKSNEVQNRIIDEDNKSENNQLSDLQSITFDASRENTNRTRSDSPNRALADMRFFQPSIVFWNTESLKHPTYVTDFMMRFRSIIHGQAVIPHYLKSRITTAAKGPNSPLDFEFGQLPESRMDVEQLWKGIQKVFKETTKLHESGGYESNWQEAVVNPLLNLAVEHFGLEDRMAVMNVDTVRIDPAGLRPCDTRGKNQKVQVKRIDTILALELPTDRVDSAFAKWPKADGSFMQSTVEYCCRSPIVVNIEVKKTIAIDPLAQLGIWSAAGFQKRRIDGDEKEKSSRIPMPCLAIVGDRWQLHIAYRHSNDSVVLAGPMSVGNTGSYIGICQILSCLGILMDWGVNEYDSWLEDVVWKRLEKGPK